MQIHAKRWKPVWNSFGSHQKSILYIERNIYWNFQFIKIFVSIFGAYSFYYFNPVRPGPRGIENVLRPDGHITPPPRISGTIEYRALKFCDVIKTIEMNIFAKEKFLFIFFSLSAITKNNRMYAKKSLSILDLEIIFSYYD